MSINFPIKKQKKRLFLSMYVIDALHYNYRHYSIDPFFSYTLFASNTRCSSRLEHRPEHSLPSSGSCTYLSAVTFHYILCYRQTESESAFAPAS